MNILINILVALACLIIGYLIGSTNISIRLGKWKFNQDPRDYGSHNPGATNCGRLWGKKYFVIVFIYDSLKTIAPLYICWAILTFVPFNNGLPLLPSAADMYNGLNTDYMIQWPVYWTAALGAMFGGVFPLFLGFKGGKAASSMVGITLTTSWLFAIFCAISYYIVLRKSRFVSLSSIISSVINAIVAWTWAILLLCNVIPHNYWQFFVNWGPMLYCNYVYAILMSIISVVLIIRHRTNIGRIKAGTEREITWMKSKKKVEI